MIAPYLFLLYLSVCVCLCLCRHTQTIACGEISAHLQSVWVRTWLTTRSRVHLKDLSEWTREVDTETLVFSLFSTPELIQIWAAARWKLEYCWHRDSDRSTRTKLRLFLQGDKFQAQEKCWGVCFGWYVVALSAHTGKHTHLLFPATTHTYTRHHTHLHVKYS